MKHRFLFCLLLILPMIVSCSRKEYDISEGFNKDLTLFEEEISVPLGNIAPITLGSGLDQLNQIAGLGDALAGILKVGDDDNLFVESIGTLFKINAYELEKQMADPNVAQIWNTGYEAGYPAGAASMFAMFGLKPSNQKVAITVDNPLKVDVPATSAASYNYDTDSGDETVNIPELSSFTFKKRTTEQEVVTLVIPETVTNAVNFISFTDLALSLPANPTSKISDDTGNLFFAINYRYTCNLAVGETFSFPGNDVPVHAAKLPVAKFKVKKFEVTLEVENTVPLALTVSDIKALKPKENESDADVVNDNVKITTGITIPGGTLENPANAKFTLAIEALEGTLPDIDGLLLNFALKAQPGLGVTTLSAKQGIRIKSASAKLTDGITIPLN